LGVRIAPTFRSGIEDEKLAALAEINIMGANQEEHHRIKTFVQEYEEFLKLHGFNAGNFG